MNSIDIVNGMIFDALSIEKGTFKDRLIAQKKIYLLQETGLDLGFSYNWYVHGPYSPALANYLYTKLEMLKERPKEDMRFSENAQKCLQKIDSIIEKKPYELEIDSWLELVASVRYIIRNWNSSNPYEDLVKYKPQFTIEQFELANNSLNEIYSSR